MNFGKMLISCLINVATETTSSNNNKCKTLVLCSLFFMQKYKENEW